MNRRFNKRNPQPCVYCGKVARPTRDHVIPQCLFSPPIPPDLIIVPACLSCNNEKSKDDALLRDMLLADFMMTGEEAVVLRERMYRADRKWGTEVGRAARRSSGYGPVFTNSGLFVGNYPTYTISGPEQDQLRLQKIFERFARGLYFDSSGKLIPNGYAFLTQRLLYSDPLRFHQSVESHRQEGPFDFGTDFSYRFFQHPSDEFPLLYELEFYKCVRHVVVVMSESEVPTNAFASRTHISEEAEESKANQN